MASRLIPDVEQKHAEIDALIPIDLHANLENYSIKLNTQEQRDN